MQITRLSGSVFFSIQDVMADRRIGKQAKTSSAGVIRDSRRAASESRARSFRFSAKTGLSVGGAGGTTTICTTYLVLPTQGSIFAPHSEMN